MRPSPLSTLGESSDRPCVFSVSFFSCKTAPSLSATSSHPILFRPCSLISCSTVFTINGRLNAPSERNSDQKLFSKALVVTEQEFAYSTKESYKPWKPFSLGSSTLIATAIFTSGLAIVLGILQWQNTRHGALFFASTANGFTILEDFLYRCLPTLIVVLYAMAWSWIDLDVMRLESWLQLAQSGGASADSSLLLQHPADFLPLVPFKAAELRSVMVLY